LNLMKRFRVVVTDYDYPSLDEERAVLEATGAELDPHQARTEAELVAICRDADVVLTQYAPLTARVIDALDRCRGIVRYGVGVDTVDIPAATRRGIWVCNVPDYGVDEVSDHAVTLLLALARKLIPMAEAVQAGRWDVNEFKPIRRLRGRTLGLIGLGRIGSAVARKARPFGLRVIAADPYRPAEYFAERHVEAVGLDDLLAAGDYVSVHAPLTEETHHLIGERELGLMKPTAFLINTARGGVVDGRAVAGALREGRIAGAGLDVVEREPIAPDDPLLGLPNCIITPHAAWHSDEAFRALKTLAAEEAARLLLGQPPRCPVNEVVSG
jgi:D-3-phosphoglycerate dehydrogenase / 2-oxoglutarate reductase